MSLAAVLAWLPLSPGQHSIESLISRGQNNVGRRRAAFRPALGWVEAADGVAERSFSAASRHSSFSGLAFIACAADSNTSTVGRRCDDCNGAKSRRRHANQSAFAVGACHRPASLMTLHLRISRWPARPNRKGLGRASGGSGSAAAAAAGMCVGTPFAGGSSGGRTWFQFSINRAFH
jgi:hypothetical protein